MVHRYREVDWDQYGSNTFGKIPPGYLDSGCNLRFDTSPTPHTCFDVESGLSSQTRVSDTCRRNEAIRTVQRCDLKTYRVSYLCLGGRGALTSDDL